ncbi:glycosyl hydrolase family 76 protein [Peziza echinospora]|nr:glycosyl hydrolase family 76 protein [Peziza echinospora]
MRLSTSWRSTSTALTGLLVGLQSLPGNALTLNIDDVKSVRGVAQVLTNNLMEIYNGNKTGGIPGRFDGGHYWWEAGAVMGAFIDYWAITQDAGHNPMVMQAMLHQVGEDWNYEPSNVTSQLGNDDQAFWCLAALAAAERKFPDPPADQPQWIALAQAVFNRQVTRWEPEHCGGGMRWQVVHLNKGWDYKNAVSNGLFFQISARLARYTGNSTYAEHAEKMYDWLHDTVKFVSPEWKVFDGAHVTDQCVKKDFTQWSYNAGIMLAGSAVMYNITTDPAKKQIWKNRVDGFLEGTNAFFSPDPAQANIMYEAACEPRGNCNRDQRSFKAYLARFMAMTVQAAPYTADKILPKLRISAVAAAKQCDGAADGKTCGMRWTRPTSDWSFDEGILGQTLSALEVVQNTQILKVAAPATAATGGTSKGDPNAGSKGMDYAQLKIGDEKITKRDVAGAVFLTLLVTGFFGGLAWFMMTDVLV